MKNKVIKGSTQQSYPRNYVIPIGLWEMCFTDKKINANEMALAVYIDSLVVYKKLGCWASNETLGKKFGWTKWHVSSVIKKLKALGILRQVGWVTIHNMKLRLLETSWSRICDPGIDELGRKEARRRLKTSIQKKSKTSSVRVKLLPLEELNSVSTIVQNHKGTLVRNHKGTIVQNHNQVLNTKVFNNNREYNSPAGAGEGACFSSSQKTLEHGECQFDKDCAALLHKKIKQEGNDNSTPVSLRRWPAEFAQLRKQRKDNRREIMYYLRAYVSVGYGQRYIPDIQSAKAFREKYISLKKNIDRMEGREGWFDESEYDNPIVEQ